MTLSTAFVSLAFGAAHPRRTRTAAFIAALALAPLAAAAQVTSLPNGSTLTGGLSTFSDLALGNYVSFTRNVGEVSYTATQLLSGSDPRLWRITPQSYGPGFTSNDKLLFVVSSEGVRIDLGTPVNALGLGGIGNITGGYVIFLDLYAGNTLLGGVLAGGTAGFQGNTGVTFVGAQSVTAFDRVQISTSAFGFAMNHFAIGAVSAVPEPTAGGMLALGLAALALVARRHGQGPSGLQA